MNETSLSGNHVSIYVTLSIRIGPKDASNKSQIMRHTKQFYSLLTHKKITLNYV